MSRRYLLDTNILSHALRNPRGRAANAIRAAGRGAICTSIIVASEMRHGAIRNGSREMKANVEALLDSLDVLPFGAPADRLYGEVRTDLEARGLVIGQFDMLIAAHALAEDCVVVTDNVREFERVEGLRVENWLR